MATCIPGPGYVDSTHLVITGPHCSHEYCMGGKGEGGGGDANVLARVTKGTYLVSLLECQLTAVRSRVVVDGLIGDGDEVLGETLLL